MIDALTLTESGMLNDIERLRVISHNLANAGTVGFKREVALLRPFFDHLAHAGTQLVISRPVTGSSLDSTPGALKYSGGPLDLSIDGDAYFVVAGPSAEAYTRQGSFHLDADGRLMAANGLPVQGEGGDIRLSAPEPRVDEHGGIWEDGNLVARLRLVRFPDQATLTSLGDGVYGAGAASPQPADGARVRQGYLEAANVVGMREMVRLIETVRHFESSQRVLRSYDEMMDRAINVLGEV